MKCLWIVPAVILAAGCGGAGPGSDGGCCDATVDAGGAGSDAAGGDATPGTDATASTDATGAGGLGAACTTAAECASGTCGPIGFGMGETRCTAPCDAANTACPEMGVCWVPGAFAGWCVGACDPAAPDCPPGLTCSLVAAPPDQYGCTP